MKNTVKFLFFFLIISNAISAQKYITKNGKISFFSKTPVENIEAHNQQVNSALDISSGDLVFKVLIKSFEFEKALMQEHFNENYLESDKFPNATFIGKVFNIGDIDFSKDGTYDAKIEGNLTIHGVTKKVRETGTFTVKDGKIKGMSKFVIFLKDYEIKVPSAVVKNIAESIDIIVDVTMSAIK
ncbi:YceI family protein [candidate division KSB1 bacterium]